MNIEYVKEKLHLSKIESELLRYTNSAMVEIMDDKDKQIKEMTKVINELFAENRKLQKEVVEKRKLV